MMTRSTPAPRPRSLRVTAVQLLALSLLALGLLSTGCRGQDEATAGAGAAEAAGVAEATAARPLTGMITIDEAGAVFTACHTRTRVPVATDGDYPALAAAYQQWSARPGEPLLITVRGHIAVPPAADPDRQTPHLLIDRFDGIWPGETCGRPGATAQLRDMYWKLTRLHDQPVKVGERSREPHLVLHTDGRRLTGSGGCNRLQGTYELQDERLVFGRIGVTRMYCEDVQDQEQAFLVALELVAGWRLEGQHLELLDADGAVLLRCEERPLTQ
jgi:copper homeostasis protein (lipoprotein)